VPLSRVVLAAEKCQLYTARMPKAAVTNADNIDAQAAAARQQSDTPQQQQQQQQLVGRTSLLRKAIVLSDSSLSSSQNTTDATSPRTVTSKAQQQLQRQQTQLSISGARLYHIVWPFSCSLEHSLTTPTTSSTSSTDGVSAAAVATALLHTVSIKADLIQARLFLDTRLPEAVYTQVVQPLLDGIAAMSQQTESDSPVETEPMISPVPVTSTADGVTASGIVVNSDSNNGTITVATTAPASDNANAVSSSSAQVSLVSQILACSSGSGTLVSGGMRITAVNNLHRQSAPVANFKVFDVEGALRLSSDKRAAQNQGKSKYYHATVYDIIRVSYVSMTAAAQVMYGICTLVPYCYICPLLAFRIRCIVNAADIIVQYNTAMSHTYVVNLLLLRATVCFVLAGALGIAATLLLAGQIASDYYNPRILAWEPLIEPWGAKLQVELNGTGATTVRSNNLTHKGANNMHACTVL
jgi:hypothetical protein